MSLPWGVFGGTLLQCAASVTGGDEMAPSGSPTVRRRRLAAELRRLRGNRTGGEIARGVGWSTSKVSRAESGRESLPPAEIKKLIDFYGVADPLRGRLLELAEDAVQRGWWDDYAGTLSSEYLEFIGLEAEAVACLQWQSDVIPGLLQTEAYSKRLNAAFRTMAPNIPPSAGERFVRVRMLRQERLVREPVLHLSVIIDESVLLRGIGGSAVMRPQLAHLLEMAELPNIDVRVLPLHEDHALAAGPFVILRLGSLDLGADALGDIVSTETLSTALYIEGETDTHLFRLFFQALSAAALPSDASRDLIVSVMRSAWS